MTYLFGPVNSRRLGCSPGLDLVPPKTCTYECIYCELGPTRRPMTAPDLAQALGLPIDLVQQRLKRLCESGLIFHSLYQEEVFYNSQPGTNLDSQPQI
jgi:wyosine [tRNA(Phe)-imidazoG37] synthetase (radical SAM superfamily)